MKIHLDTINKTITIEEDVNLHDFYEELNSLLPGGVWREYSLKVNVIEKIDLIPNTQPNIIYPIYPNTYPTHPTTQPQIWYTTFVDINDRNDYNYIKS